MAQTYDAIASYTFGSAASSYTFSSLPASWTDLILVISGTCTTSAQNINLTFNGDTGTNYSRTYLNAVTSAGSGRDSNQSKIYVAYFGTSQGSCIINVFNYANSTTYKTVLARNNMDSTALDAKVGLWRSTAAITSLTLTADSTSMAANTTLTLYGVKSA